jgi:hypothetical protein
MGAKFICGQDNNIWNSGDVHPFIENPSALKIQRMHHVNKHFTFIIFLLFFMEVNQMLVEETNKYYNQ